MKPDILIQAKVGELRQFAESYTKNNKPVPEGLIFMIEALDWVLQ